eukprot:scaffold12548_cov134-Skeletonema_dohrnii-CCMP3373.AAC.2
MVSLSSMFVLSEYWSSEVGQYSSGKLRVRGVQIRGVLSKLLNLLEAVSPRGGREQTFWAKVDTLTIDLAKGQSVAVGSFLRLLHCAL